MRRNKILFWYVFRELSSPFVLGLLIFTFILLMNKILKLMDMVINKGVSITEVGSMVMLLMPSLLVMTLPMSILLSVLICLGRLSGDSELTAMKVSGVSLYQLLPPFTVFCVAGFMFTSLLTLYLLPMGNHAFRSQLVDLAKKHSGATLEEGVFNDSFDGVVVYINKFKRKKNRIHGILISDKRESDFPTIIAAKYANIFSVPETGGVLFRLFKGSLHRFNSKDSSYQYALFDEYEMNLQFESGEEERELKRREMGMLDLIKMARKKRQGGSSAVRIKVEIHKRLAFPFACLVFGLLGLSLGSVWRRGGRAYGFVLSIVIVFLYYLFLSIGENLAKSGYLFPFMGIWMPNVVMGAVGIYLFRRVAREQETFLQKAAVFYDRATAAIAKKRLKRKAG